MSDTGDEFSVGVGENYSRTCRFYEGEKITSVVLTYDTELGNMIFKSSRNRACVLGTRKGPHSKEILIPEDKQLVGVKGTISDKYISGIALLYE